jgi:glycosyltransferase involved in cell wall biosynthesis
MNNHPSSFSIITPSYKQLDWLRLCVASVRDQVALNAEGGNLKAETTPVDVASHFTGQENQEPGTRNQEPTTNNSPPLQAVEHIIQDAGTPGIEEFAREIGADFYRDGEHIFSSQPSGFSPQVSSLIPQAPSRHPLPATRNYRVAVYCEADGGMYDAINRGLARATGELCAYLNCDEQYLPGALHRVTDWFSMNPKKGVLFADAILLAEDGHALSYRRTVLPNRLHTRLCHLNTLTCSTFFRRAVFEAGHRFPVDKKVIGDGVWVDGMLAANVPMGYLREATSAYTFTGANLSELDQGANSEQARWGCEPGAPPRWLKLAVMLAHRFQKLLAGAYWKRNLIYSVFSIEHPLERKLFKASQVGGGWPGQKA